MAKKPTITLEPEAIKTVDIENIDLKERLIQAQKEAENWRFETIFLRGKVEGLNMAIKSFNFPDDSEKNLG